MSTEFVNNSKSNKVAWSSEEDSVLLKLVGELGTNGSWTIISTKMVTRTGKQCRERYHNHLKPDVNKTLFSKEEDELVNELQAKMGNQWAKIAKFFKGRTDNSVKNRWHIINRCRPSRASAESVIVRKQPFIPKLDLNSTARSVITIHDGSDLQSLYHGHDCHGHEITDSSRSRPPTGRRNSPRSTAASMEEVIFAQSQMNMNCDSLGSTMTSTTTTSSSSGSSCSSSSSCEDEDSWLDDLLSGDEPFSSDYSSDEDDDWSHHSDDNNAERGPLSYSRDALKNLLNRNVFSEEESSAAPVSMNNRAYDTFSEAALTAREDPDCSLFDNYSGGVDRESTLFDEQQESDDLFLLFDDNMSLCGSAKPSPQLRCFLSRLSDLTPRTTPRSPACPNVKRHRGAPPGGSPFRLAA